MPRVGNKELHGLVYRLFLFQAEAGIVLQKNNFKVKLKRKALTGMVPYLLRALRASAGEAAEIPVACPC